MCTYPGDKFGAGNLPSTWAKSQDPPTFGSEDVAARCGHCFDHRYDPERGQGAVFCYVDKKGLIHALNVKYNLDAQDDDSKDACDPSLAKKIAHLDAQTATFSTVREPPASCVVQRGTIRARQPG